MTTDQHSLEKACRPKSINALTSLRFFAAVIIVIHHSKRVFDVLDIQWLHGLHTHQPVSFFFVLSGFILAYVYPPFERLKDIQHFLIARIARIWPLHIATFLLVLLLIPAGFRTVGNQEVPNIIITNLFLVQSWIPVFKYYFSYNAVSWAVSVEFAFYLLFPWLLYAWKRTWHIKLLCAGFMVVAIITYSNIADMPSGLVKEAKNHIGWVGLVSIGPLGRLFEFVFGMTLALFFHRLKNRINFGRTIGTIIEAIALILVVVMMFMTTDIVRSIFLLCPWIGESGKAWLIASGLPCGFYAILILSISLEKGYISQLLANTTFRKLGEMSFSIFLLHQVLIRYYVWRIKDTTAFSDWFVFVSYWVVLLIGSYILMVLIEHPCQRIIVGLKSSSR